MTECGHKKSGSVRRYLAAYTVVFVLLCAVCFGPFALAGRSLVGNGDGVSQYILQLRYMGLWLRETLRGFLHGDFHPRAYDFTIGMGDDINAIVRFHPLDFLSVFVPAQHTELLYDALFFIRLYLAGLSFSAFAFACLQGRSGLRVLTGAVVYLFCGFTFELGIVHPIYLAPMILLPLQLLGAERLMKETRARDILLFAGSIALGFISNYYFMYISSFGLLAYVLIRFPQVFRTQRPRHFARLFVKLMGGYLLGLGLSACVLLPSLARYLSSSRSGREGTALLSLLVYEDRRRYVAWFLNLISPLRASGNGTHLNFAVTVLPAAVLLLTRRRGKRAQTGALRAGWMLCLACLLVPALGYVLAVMNTENNRWVYLIAWTAALTVVCTAEDFGAMTALQRRALAAVTLLFDAAAAAQCLLDAPNLYNNVAAAELTVTVLLFLRLSRSKNGADVSARAERLLFAATVISAGIGGVLTFGRPFGNLVQYYADAGTSLAQYEESDNAAYLEMIDGAAEASSAGEADVTAAGESGDAAGTATLLRETSDFARADGEFAGNKEDNAALYLGYPGVQIYNSIINAQQVNALRVSGNAGLTTLLHVHALDGNTAQEALAGVRWYMTDEENRAAAPYGCAESGSGGADETLTFYENPYALTKGFAVSAVLTESSLAEMGLTERSLSLLTAAVLDDETAGAVTGLSAADPAYAESFVTRSVLEIPAENEDGTITWTDGTLRVLKAGSSLTWTVDLADGQEYYLELTGLKKLSGAGRLRIETDGISKELRLLADGQTYTTRRDEYCVRLGEGTAILAAATAVGEGAAADTAAAGETEALLSESKMETDGRAGRVTITLTFTKKGRYTFERAALCAVDTAFYEETLPALAVSAPGNLTVGKDSFTAQAEAGSAEVVTFPVLWSSGWRAAVNGEEAEVLRTGLCYCGVLLESAGSYEITFVYRTPGAAAGRMVTLLSALALAVLCAAVRKRTGKRPAGQPGGRVEAARRM